MELDYRVCGLDFGNFALKLCVYRYNEPIPVTLQQGSFSIPSVIVLNGDNYMYGYQANAFAFHDASKVVFDLLRWILQNRNLGPRCQDSHSIIPSMTPVRRDSECFFDLGDGHRISLREAVSNMLTNGLDNASRFLSYGPITHLSLSVPLFYTYSVIETLYSILLEKKITFSLYWEPEACVLAHLYKSHSDFVSASRHILVCSFGGSSLDVSVVSTVQDISIKRMNVYYSLGGNSVTKIIRNYLQDRLSHDHPGLRFRPVSYLQMAAEEVKRSLYEGEDAELELSRVGFVEDESSVVVTLEDLRGVLQSAVRRVANTIDRYLELYDDIEILICGNEARSPFLHEVFGEKERAYRITWYDRSEWFSAYGACLCLVHNQVGIDVLRPYHVREIDKTQIEKMKTLLGPGIDDGRNQSNHLRSHMNSFYAIYYDLMRQR